MIPFQLCGRFIFRLSVLIILAGILGTGLAQPIPAEQSYLYWTHRQVGEIWRSHADGSFLEQLIQRREVVSVSVDPENDWIYFNAGLKDGGGELYRTRPDGSERMLLLHGVSDVSDMELELAGGKIYMLESSNRQVSRANLDGSGYEVLVTITSGGDGLALDVEDDKMYYEVGNTAIHVSNLDGSNAQRWQSINNTHDIEVDSANNKMYSCTANGVRRCDLDGNNCEILDPMSCGDIQIVGDSLYYHLGSDLVISELDGSNPQSIDLGYEPKGWQIDTVNNRIYSAKASLFRSDLDGSNLLPLAAFPSDDLHGIAVDGANEVIYFTDGDLDMVAAADIDRIHAKKIREQQGISSHWLRGVDFDPQTSTVFLANVDTPLGGVWQVGMDGSDLTEMISGIDSPHDVAVDSIAGKVYWTEGIFDGDETTLIIRRANFDGSEAETVVSGLSQRVRGLEVDAVHGKIYWGDATNDQVWSANLDGSSTMSIADAVDVHDVAVDPAAGYIYWTQGFSGSTALTGAIMRANLDGSSPVTVHSGLGATIRDLAFVSHRNLGIFEDGFESGVTSAWSTAVP